MKALLLKDTYTLLKKMKVFGIVLLLYAFMPIANLKSLAVLLAALMPITAFAYDEHSKWDILAAMMPYSIRQIVYSKYLLASLAILGALIFNIVVGFGMELAVGSISDNELYQYGLEGLMGTLITALAALMLMSIVLPMIFRFGTEKGRVIMALLAVGAWALVALLISDGDAIALLPGELSIGLLLAGTVVLTAAFVMISMSLSTKFYLKKKGQR